MGYKSLPRRSEHRGRKYFLHAGTTKEEGVGGRRGGECVFSLIQNPQIPPTQPPPPQIPQHNPPPSENPGCAAAFTQTLEIADDVGSLGIKLHIAATCPNKLNFKTITKNEKLCKSINPIRSICVFLKIKSKTINRMS